MDRGQGQWVQARPAAVEPIGLRVRPPHPTPPHPTNSMQNLDLKRGGDRYIHTAAYGHFGRDDHPEVFTWEKVVEL